MLVEWVKQRFALCSCRPGAWHFRKTFRAYHGGRYCLACWMQKMTSLPKSSLAWRIAHTDIARQMDESPFIVKVDELRRGFINSLLMIARGQERIADALERREGREARRGQRR